MHEMQRAIVRIVVHEPEIGVDEIRARLHEKGFCLSRFAVASIRANVRLLLKVLAAEGLLKRLPQAPTASASRNTTKQRRQERPKAQRESTLQRYFESVKW